MPAFITDVNMPSVFIANAVAIILGIILLFSKKKQVRMVTFTDKIFCTMCCFVIGLAGLETIAFCHDGILYPGAAFVYRSLNVIIFCASVILSYIWVLYVDYKLFEDIQRIKRIYIIRAIPSAVICILALLNLFFDIFFQIIPENVYIRLPATMFTALVIYANMTYGMILALQYRNKVSRYIFMPVVFFSIPVYIGSALQMVFYGISVMWVSVAVALTSLYINIQNEESFLDALTRIYNRNYLFSYMANALKRIKRGEHMAGIMMDINSFKHINDAYGHVEGDYVLRVVAGILRKSIDNDALAARYGGDEFVVIIEHATDERVTAIQESIQKELEEYNRTSKTPYDITIAMGSCEFDMDDVDEFFKSMDRAMYEKKRDFYLDTHCNRR